ncbi:carbon starvation protein A, partial [Escherichia coli]|nr:carbon starvation protein A [Escherichia coli]
VYKRQGAGSIIARSGGAPTWAVRMAFLLHGALGGTMQVAFWFHFATVFEALCFLTAVVSGPLAARFLFHVLLGAVSPG